MGFDAKAIEKLSNYAFKSNVRTLESFNNNINNMYRLGVLTSASVDNYIEDIVKSDGEISTILQELGINRGVISTDRNMYKVWLYDWNASSELIKYAVELSKGKYSAMQYLNRVLSEYHNAGIKSVDEAKNFKLSFASSSLSTSKTTSPKRAKKREYSKKELDSLFDDITEIEI